jgi:hypothetical protein
VPVPEHMAQVLGAVAIVDCRCEVEKKKSRCRRSDGGADMICGGVVGAWPYLGLLHLHLACEYHMTLF